MTSEETITISLAEYNAMKTEIEYLGRQLAELKRMIFGSKSERFISSVDPQQGLLFELPSVEKPAEIHEEITYTRTKPEDKKQPLRTEIPAHLPRKEEVIEPENIPAGAKKIGEAVSEILEYEPAQIYVRRIIRPKYLIQSTDEQTNIIIAELPNLPIPKGNAGPGFLAQITTSKFVDHLPFYRQAQISLPSESFQRKQFLESYYLDI